MTSEHPHLDTAVPILLGLGSCTWLAATGLTAVDETLATWAFAASALLLALMVLCMHLRTR